MSQIGCAPKWTAEQAKEKAFQNIQTKIDLSKYSSRDPNYGENQKVLKAGGGKTGSRFIDTAGENLYVVSELDQDGTPSITMAFQNNGHVP